MDTLLTGLVLLWVLQSPSVRYAPQNPSNPPLCETYALEIFRVNMRLLYASANLFLNIGVVPMPN